MKLHELKTIVDHYMNNPRNAALEVCIPNGERLMGPMGVTMVKGANAGIDWDNGKFIIFPQNEMKEL